ncbi:MAG TPA: YdeI/OmpD-associated family protein [Aquihabitans sp.]|nr:YdeI/OmpD-associated family protein [Aquihabitans sp.]
MTTFTATLQRNGKTATGIEVPEAVVTSLGAGKRPPVTVTIGGFEFRTTIAPMAGSWWIPVSAERRAGAGIAAGDQLEVHVELDTAPRTVDVPDDLAAALDAAPGARAAWDRLSPSHQRAHVDPILAAKKPETRQRRVAKALEALEGR